MHYRLSTQNKIKELVRQVVYKAMGVGSGYGGQTYNPAKREDVLAFERGDADAPDPFKQGDTIAFNFSEEWRESHWNHTITEALCKLLQEAGAQANLPPVTQEFIEARIYRVLDNIKRNFSSNRHRIDRSTGELETDEAKSQRLLEADTTKENRDRRRGIRVKVWTVSTHFSLFSLLLETRAAHRYS